jgi:hypothetical protein
MFWTPLFSQGCTDVTVKQANISSATLWGDFVYLDVDERRRFVSAAHEYLIEQVQYTSYIALPAATSQTPVPIELNHPTREFFWVLQTQTAQNNHEWFNYSSLSITETGVRTDLLSTAVLQLDGFDRFQVRDAPYFRLVQPWQRHTAIPNDDYIYMYSFALKPEDLQPSGSMNASRIDSMTLQLELNNTVSPARGPANVRIYALNHNVLRVIDGFGGLLFRI